MNRPGTKQPSLNVASKQHQQQAPNKLFYKQQRKLSPSQYARTLARIGIAQILQTIGFQSIQSTALDVLVDILERYTMLLGKSARDFAELCNRTEPTLEDLAVTFSKYRVGVDDLGEFVKWVDTPEFALHKHARLDEIAGRDVERSQEELTALGISISKEKSRKRRREYLGFCDDPDNKELLERQSDEEFEYVYDYMPLMTRETTNKFDDTAHLEMDFPHAAMLTDSNDATPLEQQPNDESGSKQTTELNNQSVVVKEGKKYINNAWKSMYEPRHIKRLRESAAGQIVARQSSVTTSNQLDQLMNESCVSAEVKSAPSINLVNPAAKLPTSYKKPSNNKYKQQIFMNAVNVCNKSSTNYNQLADELIEEEVASRMRQAQQQKELLESQMSANDVARGGEVGGATSSGGLDTAEAIVMEDRVRRESGDVAASKVDQMLEACMNKYTSSTTAPVVPSSGNRVSNLKIRIKENSVVSSSVETSSTPMTSGQQSATTTGGAIPKLKLTKINNNSEFNFATTSALSSTSQFLSAYNEDKEATASAISPDSRVFFTSGQPPNLEDENAMDGLNVTTDTTDMKSANNMSEPLIWRPEIGSDSPQNETPPPEPIKSDTSLAKDRTETTEEVANSKAAMADDGGVNKKKKKKKKNKNKEKQKEKIHKKQKKHKKKEKSKEKTAVGGGKDDESSFVTMGEESGNESAVAAAAAAGVASAAAATGSKKKDKELKKKLKKEKKRQEKMATGGLADTVAIETQVDVVQTESKVETVPTLSIKIGKAGGNSSETTVETTQIKSPEEQILTSNNPIPPPPLPKLKLKIGQQDMSGAAARPSEPLKVTATSEPSAPAVKPLKISFGGKAPSLSTTTSKVTSSSHIVEPPELGEIVRHAPAEITSSMISGAVNLSTFMPTNQKFSNEQSKPPSVKKPFDPMKKLNASKSSSHLVNNPSQQAQSSTNNNFSMPRNTDELSLKKKKISEPLEPAALALFQSQKMFFKGGKQSGDSTTSKIVKQETTTTSSESDSAEWHQQRVKQEEDTLREQLLALNASRMKNQPSHHAPHQSSSLTSHNQQHSHHHAIKKPASVSPSSSLSSSSGPSQPKIPKKHSATPSPDQRPVADMTMASSSQKKPNHPVVLQTESVGVTPVPPETTSSELPSEMKIIGTAVTEVVSSQLWICPACKRHDESKPMIGCDSCDDWYHWSCIGIVEEPPENQNWYCHKCGSKTENNTSSAAGVAAAVTAPSSAAPADISSSAPSPSQPDSLASDYLMSLKKKKKKSS